MNVDGAFILAETRRKTSVLLFDNSMQIFLRYISYEFGKMFITRITLSYGFKKKESK